MCFTNSTKPTNINQTVTISGIEQEHYTPMLRWERSDQLIAFEFCFFLYSLFLFTLKWNVMQQEKKNIYSCVHTLKKLSITNWLLDWQEWLRKHIKTDFKGHVSSYCVRALSMLLFLIQPQLFYSPGLT